MATFVLASACGGGSEGAGDDVSGDETGIEDTATAGDGESDSGSPADGESDSGTAEDATSGDAEDDGATTDGAAADGATTDSTATDTKPATDGAAGDTAGADSGGDTAGAGLPTITILTPTAGAAFKFASSGPTADVCQPIGFSVSYTAPNGFNTMRWRFLTPNAASGVTGTCNGLPAYGYFMKQSKYTGQKAGTFTFDESMAGLYKDASNSGRWWWCTWPGTKPGFDVSLESMADTNPGLPGSAGYQTLSNYCYSNSKGATPTDPTQQWTFEVTLADALGNTVTATRKFWIHN